ncbi:MAG: pentapeptide repeat-containing protein, partial [Gammaproteobacteria bacterium]|nr:pentapeptide repeat-containing protein [Gammaproteobacteria bacterium]
MWKKPITDVERDLLTRPAEFNRQVGAHGWRLEGKIVNEIKIDGLDVLGGEFVDVDMLKTKIDNSHFRDFTFNKVRFHEGRIKNTIFENVTFKDCEFILEELIGDKCVRCKFIGTKITRSTGEKTGYFQTEFSSHVENESSYNEMEFVDVTYTDASFGDANHPLQYYDSNFTNYALRNVDGFVKYGSKRIRKLSIVGGELGVNFYGDMEDITVEKTKKIDLSFGGGQKKIERISIKNIDLVGNLSFAKGNDIQNIRIENIGRLFDLNLDGKIKNLVIKNCQVIDLGFEKAEIIEGVIFERSPIKGMAADDSLFKGISFVDSDIYDYLYLRRNTFEGLTFKNSVVRPGTELIDENIQYK